MRIGITGASGFIGRALAITAAAEGHEVIAYSRNALVAIPGSKEVRPIDFQSDTVLEASDLDALVHLAGENVFGLWTKEKKQRIHDSRVQATQRLVAALGKSSARPGVFLCGSGTGAYGSRGDEILTENSSRGDDFLAEVCRGWEGAALRAEDLGMRVALLRTGMVLGPGGGGWPKLRTLFNLCLGARLGDGKQWVPWIHLEDEVGIILHALMQSGISGPVNLAGPNPVSNAEFTRAIATRLHRFTGPPVPKFVLTLLMRDLSQVILGSQRVEPQVALSTGYQFRYPSLESALAALP